MGAVVAMTRWKTWRAGLAAMTALAVLAGCSSDPTGTNPQQLLTEFFTQDVRTRGKTAANESAEEIAQLTRARIAGVTTPLLLAELPSSGAASTLSQVSIKGDIITWLAVDRVSLTFDGPVLFSSRGIGADLLAAETDQLSAMLLAGQSGNVTRDLRFLDGLDQIIVVPVSCAVQQQGSETITVLEVRHSTRKATETCSDGEDISFENIFWIGSDGTLWKSRQWLSPRLEYVETERLIR